MTTKPNFYYLRSFISLIEECGLQLDQDLTNPEIEMKRKIIKHVKLFYKQEKKQLEKLEK